MLRISDVLKCHSIPRLDVELLLAHVVHRDRAFIIANPAYRLSLIAYFKFLYYLRRRSKGIPLAYITHHKEFFGLDFYVDKNVLIPRSDTEVLVESVIDEFKISDFRFKNNITVLIDVGTGSGCIPVAILKNILDQRRGEVSSPKLTDVGRETLPLRVFATEISKPALKIAQRNAKTHHVDITFLQGDLLEPLTSQILNLKSEILNIVITANLPYGWKEWKNNTTAETIGLKYEPKQALFTSDHGLFLIKKLLTQIANLQPKAGPPLAEKLTVFLEYDPRQTEELSAAITNILPAATLEIKKDLAGLDRVAIVHLN